MEITNRTYANKDARAVVPQGKTSCPNPFCVSRDKFNDAMPLVLIGYRAADVQVCRAVRPLSAPVREFRAALPAAWAGVSLSPLALMTAREMFPGHARHASQPRAQNVIQYRPSSRRRPRSATRSASRRVDIPAKTSAMRRLAPTSDAVKRARPTGLMSWLKSDILNKRNVSYQFSHLKATRCDVIRKISLILDDLSHINDN